MRKPLFLALAALASWLPAGPAAAQHAAVGTGLQTLGNNYFEQVGVNFGIQSGNFFFQQNSAALAAPQFGGATPSAGATTGFALPLSGGGEAFFGITASQGSRSSNVSQSPSMTLTNGVPGAFFDTTQTPFVTSFGAPADASPALARWQQLHEVPAAQAAARSTADAAPQAAADEASVPARSAGAQSNSTPSAALSVAELRQVRAQQQQQIQRDAEREIQALVERGQQAEQAGKPSVARLYFEQAARRSSGAEREQLLARARRLPTAAAQSRSERVSTPKH